MPENETKNVDRTDLDKDLQFAGSEYENMEGESHSTAKEGELMTPEQDENQQDKIIPEVKAETSAGDFTKRTSLKEDENQGKEQVSG